MKLPKEQLDVSTLYGQLHQAGATFRLPGVRGSVATLIGDGNRLLQVSNLTTIAPTLHLCSLGPNIVFPNHTYMQHAGPGQGLYMQLASKAHVSPKQIFPPYDTPHESKGQPYLDKMIRDWVVGTAVLSQAAAVELSRKYDLIGYDLMIDYGYELRQNTGNCIGTIAA